MTKRFVDLTLTVRSGMRGVAIEPHTRLVPDGYNTTNLHLYSHSGTHMDAPLHFLEGGSTIDRWPLAQLVGPAQVIDLSSVEAHGLHTVEDLLPHAAKITPGCRLLLRTDWSLHADLPDYRPDMPRISAALARWLVERQVALVGVETPSVASLRPENRAELTEVHQTILGGNIVIVESLTNLRELRRTTVEFIALPLKIDGGDGSPVRAIAVEEE
ncbi:MAG: cyclase family protein [Caldilineaceae bacterium]|mgnify:CR=1 FL=1|nr:cyclase family protein [Caldilineaceae bacterium]HRJ45545.1 cyclase family protein [Caldilineaceae bacterium]